MHVIFQAYLVNFSSCSYTTPSSLTTYTRMGKCMLLAFRTARITLWHWISKLHPALNPWGPFDWPTSQLYALSLGHSDAPFTRSNTTPHKMEILVQWNPWGEATRLLNHFFFSFFFWMTTFAGFWGWFLERGSAVLSTSTRCRERFVGVESPLLQHQQMTLGYHSTRVPLQRVVERRPLNPSVLRVAIANRVIPSVHTCRPHKCVWARGRGDGEDGTDVMAGRLSTSFKFRTV